MRNKFRALKARNIRGNYSALSELQYPLGSNQGRRASRVRRLPLAIIFRAFGAAGLQVDRPSGAPIARCRPTNSITLTPQSEPPRGSGWVQAQPFLDGAYGVPTRYREVVLTVSKREIPRPGRAGRRRRWLPIWRRDRVLRICCLHDAPPSFR